MQLPESTYFHKRIPKQKFYDNLSVSAELKREFIDRIRIIYWQNKIAASTTNLAAGETVTEIELFVVHLTGPEIPEQALRQIDREIPYHILFLLEHEERWQAWVAYKEPAGSGNNAFKIIGYYHTPWMEEAAIPLRLEGLNLDQAYENFSEHYLIKNILCYLTIFILSLILYKIERNNLERNSLIKIKNGGNSSFSSSSSTAIKYIHNAGNNAYLSNKSFFKFLFILFLWILDENLIQIFSFLKDLDFWMIEIIIISFMSSAMLKTKIYLHHKMIIFLNLIPVLFKIIAIILSFLDECNKKHDDYYYCYNYNYSLNNYNKCLSRNETITFNNNTIKEKNLSGGLKNYYVKNILLVPIGILIYISLITLRSYVNSSIKWLIDLKYISEKKLLMFYGLMGAIISSIICIITTFIECKDKGENADIYDYICKVEYSKKRYFDNFKAVHHTLENKEDVWIIILKTILGIIFFYFNKYFSMLIIKYFTPVHLIFSFPVYYFIQKIVLIINTLIQEKTLFSANRINFIEAKFSLDILGDIFSSFGFLIYLEIIELNFCELNYNLRRKISERADNEKLGYLGIEDEDEDDDEDENQNQNEMKNVTKK